MNTRDEEVEKLAYELYEKSGRINGRDLENWVEAERIVYGRNEQKTAGKRPKKGTAAEEKDLCRVRKPKAGESAALA